MRTIEVEYIIPEGVQPGDTVTIEVEVPKPEKKPRGVLAGIPLEEMTIEQLKREKINAGSVLYKAQQRNASEDIIARNQERFDRVTARLAELAPAIDEEKEAAKAAKKAEREAKKAAKKAEKEAAKAAAAAEAQDVIDASIPEDVEI